MLAFAVKISRNQEMSWDVILIPAQLAAEKYPNTARAGVFQKNFALNALGRLNCKSDWADVEALPRLGPSQ
jgi:hypothetical protein